MSRGVFITGTGTDVGKTVVTAAVMRGARTAGIDAVPFKPVQTGAVEAPDGLVAPDVAFVLAAGGWTPPRDEVAALSSFLYKPACSPHLAGRLAGRPVQVEAVLARAAELLSRHDSLIVEGAGGVMVPLNESQTMLDLMVALAMPVLVVALDGLGTINHTLLTLAVLRQAGLDVLGVVFNQPESPGEADEFLRRDNPVAIAKFGGAAVLGVLPHVPSLAGGDATSWAAVEASLTGLPLILERMKKND